MDGLIAQGVEYIYFIDEIFLPNKELLEGLAERTIKIRRADAHRSLVRTDARPPRPAGCVSIEAGVEIITEEGRAELDKKCKMSTDELADRLIYAKQRVPFVQANLIEMEQDDLAAVEQFRERLCSTAFGPTNLCRCIRIPGRPTTPSAGDSPTTAHGNARTTTIWTFTTSSAISRISAPCRYTTGTADAGAPMTPPATYLDDCRHRRRRLDVCDRTRSRT